MAVRASLLLDHVDAWILGQRSLVNGRTRSLLPIVVQRQSLADHLAKLLDKLGLDRVPTKVPSLTEYVANKYGNPDNGTAPMSVAPDTGDGHNEKKD